MLQSVPAGGEAGLAVSGRQNFPYKAFFDEAPDGMLVLSRDGEILDANPQACAMLGRVREALLRTDVWDVLDLDGSGRRGTPSGPEGVGWRRLRLVYNDGGPREAWVTSTGETPDGEYGLILREVAPEEDAARVGRVLVEKGPDLVALYAEDHTISYVSPSVEEILGYDPEELLGVSALELVHPEDLALATREASKATSGHKRKSPPLRYRHKDGSWVYLENLATNLLDEPGVEGVVVDGRDVTERELEEEELRRSEGRYRAVVEQTKAGVLLADADSLRVLESNVALRRGLGYSVEELEGMTLYELIDDDPARVEENMRRTLREERTHIGEGRYRRKDGTLADVEVYATIVPHDGTDAVCVISHDVTEPKRTEENLRRSLGVLLALREAGQILGSTLETEEIVTRLLTIMRGVSGLTAAVISVEDELGQPRIWREVGLEGLWRRARYAPQAEEARRAVLDNGEHQLFRLRGPEGEGQLVGLCLPLRMKKRIAGVLEAYGPESLAEEDAVGILESLATQAASALENARLYGELAERERRLADLIGQFFTAQEEERRRVAYEVHDGLAQIAAAAHQHLQGFARFHPPASEEARELLGQTLELVQRTVGEARRVIANLRPTVLDDFGLGTALRLEADHLRTEGYQIDYESNLDKDERLPVSVETALFRIAQEALTNVRKHAGANRLRLTLDRSEGGARLCVRDWGRGFDPSAPQVGGGPGERMGLNSMRERVALLGGSFQVQSRAGVGTLVTVEIPLAAEVPDNGEAHLGDPDEEESNDPLVAERTEDG